MTFSRVEDKRKVFQVAKYRGAGGGGRHFDSWKIVTLGASVREALGDMPLLRLVWWP